MKDGRRSNGGARKNAGRPPKSDEQELIQKLKPLNSKAFKALEDSISDNQSWAVKLWFEYMYGKPKEKIEVTNIKEQPLFGDE